MAARRRTSAKSTEPIPTMEGGLLTFLQNRAEDSVKFSIVMKYFAMNPLLDGSGAYHEILQAAKAGATVEEIRALCQKNYDNRLAPLAMHDIVTFLATGKGLFPENFLDLAGYLEEQSEKERQERIADHARLRRMEQDINAQQKADRLRREREELAKKTGIPLEKLEALASSGG